MPRELLLNVRNRGRHVDGEVISDSPVGGSITAGQVGQFFRTGEIPQELRDFPDRARRRLLIQQLRELRQGVNDPSQFRHITSRRESLLRYGLDFRWGTKDLAHFAVVTADGPPLNLDVRPDGRRRRYRVDYAVLVPEDRDAWRQHGRRVPVNRRRTPIARADVVEDSPDA